MTAFGATVSRHRTEIDKALHATASQTNLKNVAWNQQASDREWQACLQEELFIAATGSGADFGLRQCVHVISSRLPFKA